MGKGIVKLGEGNWAVKDGNLLAAKETNGRFKNTEFTVTRGTDATYVGRDGLIVNETGDDTPRIDFTNNTDGHLLLEPESTNLFSYSEDFENQWTAQSGITITNNTTETTSPSGEYNASKVVSTDNTKGFSKTGMSITANATRTIYLKGSVGGESVTLKDGSGFGGTETYSLTTDWARYELKTTADGSTYQGLFVDNISVGTIYAWGAQIEELPYATSYIPTNGSQVTRDAETCTGAGEAADFNSSEGVLYAEIAALADDLTRRRITLSDGTTNNRINLYFENLSNTIEGFIKGSGGDDTMIYTSSDTTQFHKIAVLYKDGESSLWVDGVERDTSATTFSLANLSNLDFQQGGLTGDVFYGKCKAIRVYKETDGIDLATLTS